MTGTDGNDHLIGTDGNDSLSGGAGNDILDGRGGADHMDGGSGDDLIYVDNAGDVIVERAEDGYDTVLAQVNYALAAGVHVEVLAAHDQHAFASLILVGNELANTIIGNAGANLLVGGGGADYLVGLDGDDSYLVDLDDVVAEDAGAGYDVVYTLSSYTLAAGSRVEVLTAHDQASTASLALIGNQFANTILGNAGANLLIGGGGGDILVGFGGNDDYLVTGAGDQAAENENEGFDTVYTQGSFTLGYYSHIEVLTAHDQSSTAFLALIGNQYSNTILGNAGANFIAGGGGNDVLVGFGGNDDYLVTGMNEYVAEDAGGGYDSIYTQASYTLGYYSQVELLTAHDQAGTEALALIGNQYSNTVIGNAGANFIVGGGGTDVLIGLGGNDDYLVESQSETVSEQAGGGNDSVYATVSYALAAGSHVELLTAHNQAGTAAINLSGNELANSIYGNAGANVIDGGAGDDLLAGFGGDDVYIVDSMLDVVVETAGGGNDVVAASADYTLGADAHVEVLTALDQNGFADLALTGNGFSNTIFGNDGYNVLDGGGGTDILIGLDGGDDYYVDDQSDVIVEAAGEGEDWVFVRGSSYTLGAGVHVELLAAAVLEDTSALSLTGNELSQVIAGNDGANVLNGGGGTDFLVGLLGDDTYIVDSDDAVGEDADGGFDTVYAMASHALVAGSHVERLIASDAAATTILDLEGNELSNVIVGNAGSNVLIGGGGIDTLTGLGGDDIFAFVAALGGQNVATVTDFSVADDTIALADGIFSALSVGQLSSSAFVTGASAVDADDRIIYNSQTGALLYDADGSGSTAAVQFATLTPGLALSAANFSIFASTPTVIEGTGFNDTIGTAQAVARSEFEVAVNPNLPDDTLPSVTIEGDIATIDDVDYYSVTLQAGETITFDIDATTNDLDTVLFVYSSGGVVVAENDDSEFGDSGSDTEWDSSLSYTAATGGTYYFSVESYGAASSGWYDLNVSISSSAASASAASDAAKANSSNLALDAFSRLHEAFASDASVTRADFLSSDGIRAYEALPPMI